MRFTARSPRRRASRNGSSSAPGATLRNLFIGIRLAGALPVIALILAVTQSCNKTSPPPNIILFLVDDMGWQDSSVPFWDRETDFNRRYHTPGMERLAAEGMLFTQAYANCVCSPTRVSLMSGMNAAKHRVTNWTLRRNQSVDASHAEMSYPTWNVNGLQPTDSIENATHATFLPQILQDHGYYTIHCGKAHFGAMGTPSANPLNCGFNVNIAGHAAGAPGSYLGEQNFGNKEVGTHTPPWGVPGLERYHGDSIFLTEALTREAIAALDRALEKSQPFFLYMAHYAVHIPLNADPRYYQKYLDTGLPESEASYASMLEGMDQSLSDLMNYLDEKNIADQTIVLFMSDNGGFSLRPRAGEEHSHNKPLNSGKGSAYEGGIREPMIVKWPGKTPEASRCNDYLIIEDFFPTIIEMAGIKDYSTVQEIDGLSFTPMLSGSGSSAEERPLYWHFPNNWGPTGPGIGASSTIRLGDWKLIYFYHDQHFELFNLANDIGELNNLAGQYPDKVGFLAKKLGAYLRESAAQRPYSKQSGELLPYPDELIDPAAPEP
ncbi:MAG: sulfatase [Bacteroidetes bacterium]|nr:MAG: sulfatase [Bacteroidota bacterium]